MAGKKRTKQQDLGKKGEDAFRAFASSVDLIPSKLDDDFGMDFVCITQGKPDAQGTAFVGGQLVGVAVRATESKRGKIILKRSDVEHLLKCVFPTCVCLVHKQGTSFSIYITTVNKAFAMRLAEFLKTGAKSMQLLPSDLPQGKDFLPLLKQALQSGYVESVHIHLAQHSLADVVGKTRIRVERGANGQYSLVHLYDFFGQFDLSDVNAKAALHTAVFGQQKFFPHRMEHVPVKQDVLAALARLPQPVVLGGFAGVGAEVEIAIANTDARCTFEVRHTPSHVGFVHEAGFSLTISESTKHEGQWVHFLSAHVDDAERIDLTSHPDLWAFLEACTPDAKLVFADKPGFEWDVPSFENLPQLGFFARYLRWASDKSLGIPLDEFGLADGINPECLNSLSWLLQIAEDATRMNGFGFATAGDTPIEQFKRVPETLRVPIVVNLPRRAAVTWLDCRGELMVDDDGSHVGLQILDVERAELDLLPSRLAKGEFPELVIAPNMRTIEFEDAPAQTTNSPATWGLGIQLGGGNDEAREAGEGT